MTTVLVTGGAGFIGSNYIRLVLEQGTADRVINLDLDITIREFEEYYTLLAGEGVDIFNSGP